MSVRHREHKVNEFDRFWIRLQLLVGISKVWVILRTVDIIEMLHSAAPLKRHGACRQLRVFLESEGID